MAKVGKPSKKYLLENALNDGLIQKWGELGMTDRQIADQLRVGVTILYEYKKENPKFAEVLTRARLGKPVLNAWDGLRRLATGFHEKTTRKHIKIRKDANGNVIGKEEEIIEDDYYVPPQAQACAKLLANYYHQASKLKDGLPEEYIAEPLPPMQQTKQGRLPEMEQAMQELFFNGGENDNN